MINDADHANPTVNFSREFKDAGDVVLNSYEVRGAFTKNGFAFFQNALGQPDRYISGEEWVVGKNVNDTFDPAKLQPALASRYYNEFIAALVQRAEEHAPVYSLQGLERRWREAPQTG